MAYGLQVDLTKLGQINYNFFFIKKIPETKE